MKKLKAGDRIYSKYFSQEIIITRVISDKDWYFVLSHRELKAKTPLSYFEREQR